MAKTLDHEAKVFYESDCNLGLLKGKTIAIIGYGCTRSRSRTKPKGLRLSM